MGCAGCRRSRVHLPRQGNFLTCASTAAKAFPTWKHNDPTAHNPSSHRSASAGELLQFCPHNSMLYCRKKLPSRFVINPSSRKQHNFMLAHMRMSTCGGRSTPCWMSMVRKTGLTWRTHMTQSRADWEGHAVGYAIPGTFVCFSFWRLDKQRLSNLEQYNVADYSGKHEHAELKIMSWYRSITSKYLYKTSYHRCSQVVIKECILDWRVHTPLYGLLSTNAVSTLQNKGKNTKNVWGLATCISPLSCTNHIPDAIENCLSYPGCLGK